jgi:V/A-type H+-transporting ATPase subunit I
MAIAQMAKVIIVSHRSQASQLLEALQKNGICQILNAQEAIVSKDYPELASEAKHPKDIEQLLNRLQKSISFLKNYAETPKGLASVLAPRTVIDQQAYNQVISDRQVIKIIDQCEQIETSIEKLKTEIENLSGILEMLKPWSALQTPVEEIGLLQKTKALTGLLPQPQLEQIQQQIAQLGAAVQIIGQTDSKLACLIICLNENLNDVQKLLRSAEFEPVNLESVTGTVAESIKHHCEKLNQTKNQLQSQYEKAAALSKNLLKLQILHDHYQNLLNREQTKDNAPATEQTVLLEGWVKQKDYHRLEKIVAQFTASSLSQIEPAEGEEIPVEIENKNYVRPFEAITRLYGMPVHLGIDPTACLAPFFAFFFALCLADVGYGLVMAAVIIWLLIKLQGDKKLLWLFLICASFTIPLGAITGGWFGDAVSRFIPTLNPLREKLMLFDPMEQPMTLFILSVILGYIQIMTGLLIAFAHNLRGKNYIAALCDQLTWLVMLNSIVAFGLSKAGMIPAEAGRFLGTLALVPAAAILLFSHRQGSWQARIGMGAYNLFSAVFYLGDVLSYLRLMALCMVGGGIAMSINIIAEISLGIPYLGILIMILVLVLGHSLNLVLSALGAFVHTLRLQYVEYFTKFFVGGGRPFEPLAKKYKHIYIKGSEARF